MYKCVECGRITWPRTSSELKNLSPEKFRWLMQGFAIEPLIHNINSSRSA
ncbi:MAG: hypothetical protein K6E47_08075 [Lachnospiraceae bacterium]|nr:hypothetical protein [Lachnospiraceae bacterium]